jgi:ribonuclease PH
LFFHFIQWDHSNEDVMRECLEALIIRSQNPMCEIDVTIQPMCEDGSQLAAAVNAAVSRWFSQQAGKAAF